jgi:hypothetical protein
MEIMAIHSWKSQYISVWFLVIVIYCVICWKYWILINIGALLQLAEINLVDPIQSRNKPSG